MKIVGLITEYNPFHNGHKYHIQKAKEITGADGVIVIMSGDFVQRGAPAMMPKHLRAEAALKNGASLVIELPVQYATASAEQFAFGAVSILHGLGCVDCICFGSECGEISSLKELAQILSEEPQAYKFALSSYLKEGNAFPLARQKALQAYCHSDDLANLLEKPNNILGVEYLKALYKLHSSMKPFTITRISSEYHDVCLQTEYSSASAIRNNLSEDFSSLETQVPAEMFSLFQEHYQKSFPVEANDFSFLLKYRLLTETKESLLSYLDVSEELANRICNQSNAFVSFTQFCELLKTKEITYSRVSRGLLHILLGIKKEHTTLPLYARALGFRTDSTWILRSIKEQASIPFFTKPTEVAAFQPEALDIFASNLYRSMITDKFKTTFSNEYEHPILRI